MTATVVKGKQPSARAARERSPWQRPDRRNTNRQRGSMRATSVLGNAKSERHRKTHGVEPGGAGRKFMHLTWGDPRPARDGEVSRGRSSVDARRKAGGAKGRRTTKVRSVNHLGSMAGRATKQRGATTAVATPAARRVRAGGFRACTAARGPSRTSSGKEAAEDAQ